MTHAKKQEYPGPAPQVVSIEGLTHGYSRGPLFRDVTLEIGKGDRVAIIGPNGAGVYVCVYWGWGGDSSSDKR